MKVVTSVPLIYDWTRNLMDDTADSAFFLNLIIKNGLTYHTSISGSTEENLIESAALLIYTGGPSEEWIDQHVQKTASAHPDRIVLRLLDYIENSDGSAIDEHALLSPDQALICCQKISQALCRLDPQNQASYDARASKYLELLSILDDTYKVQALKTKDKSFIICDRMPFKALFEEYGFNYLALYDYCPMPQKTPEDSQKIKELGSKIDEIKADQVYVFEDSDKKLAKQVIASSKNPKCDTLVLDSMESTTLSQLFSGKNYLDIMRNNLTLLRPN